MPIPVAASPLPTTEGSAAEGNFIWAVKVAGAARVRRPSRREVRPKIEMVMADGDGMIFNNELTLLKDFSDLVNGNCA